MDPDEYYTRFVVRAISRILILIQQWRKELEDPA
jgi:hypothetical protein